MMYTKLELDENVDRWMNLDLGVLWLADVLTPAPQESNQATAEFSVPAHCDLATDPELQHGPCYLRSLDA